MLPDFLNIQKQEELVSIEPLYNKHYVQIDSSGNIISGWSNGPHPNKDISNAICINEKGGYQFILFPSGEENPNLFDIDGIPLYKYEDGEII